MEFARSGKFLYKDLLIELNWRRNDVLGKPFQPLVEVPKIAIQNLRENVVDCQPSWIGKANQIKMPNKSLWKIVVSSFWNRPYY